jgi:hypothetical protein
VANNTLSSSNPHRNVDYLSRKLEETGPSYRNPLVVISKGSSIIFDVANNSYPEYVENSLINTNPTFDYSSFRQLKNSKGTSKRTFKGGFILSENSNCRYRKKILIL